MRCWSSCDGVRTSHHLQQACAPGLHCNSFQACILELLSLKVVRFNHAKRKHSSCRLGWHCADVVRSCCLTVPVNQQDGMILEHAGAQLCAVLVFDVWCTNRHAALSAMSPLQQVAPYRCVMHVQALRSSAGHMLGVKRAHTVWRVALQCMASSSTNIGVWAS